MDQTERHKLITELFLGACDAPEEQRRALLNERCAGDTDLCAEVESLLAEDNSNPGFLEPAVRHPSGETSDHTPPDPAAAIPSRIGDFTILKVLGEGGMGVVYQAEQEKPRRRVALKVMRPGLSSERMLKRFEYEVDVLGRLEHEGIARMLEAGVDSTDGVQRPFFAMEYVRGRMLTDYAESFDLGTRDRLALMMKVCEAVQYAHQRGVIHRDLKPGNILVDDAGRPKILDFGIARATDSDVQVTTLRSDVGQLLGTIAYMSPEQVEGNPNGLDTRSDVYALGVILYKLLAGRLPYDLDANVILEAARIIREEEPAPLGSVNRVFRGDVETIVGKALDKDRDRRYASASDLAADIGRYLADEPITARPASVAYQFRKFARRNRALVSAAVLGFLALSTVAGVAGWQALVAQREAQQRMRAENVAHVTSTFFKDVFMPADPLEQGNISFPEVVARAAKKLDGVFPDQPMAEADFRRTIGFTLLTLRDFASAEKQLRRQRELLIPVVDADDGRLRENAQWLARSLIEQNRAQEALPFFEPYLTHLRETVGIDDIKTLSLMLTHARYSDRIGKTNEAENEYIEILEAVRRIRSDDHALALICKAELGRLYGYQRRFAEAERLYREVLTARRQKLEPDHRDTLTAMNNLAGVYLWTKNFERAKPLLVEALAGQRRVWGADHRQPLVCQMNLVKAHMGLKEYDEARELCRDALARARRALGPDHYLSRAAARKLAILEQRREK